MSSTDIVLQALRAALSDKLPLWASLVSAVGLWTYAAIAVEPYRLIAAGAFTTLVYLPMLYKSTIKGS
jgi:hypothetical protein